MVKAQKVLDSAVFRPLQLVEQLTEETGTAITYAYDDIVFIEPPDVLLQFDKSNSERLHLFIDQALGEDDREKICETWLQVAQTQQIQLLYKGTFSIEQHPVKEEISIRFH